MAESYGHGYKPRVFITGISGFVGSELAQNLLDDGYHVGGLLRYSPRVAVNVEPLKGRAELFYGDLRDYSHLSWVLRTFQPDYVLHFGAITPVSYSFTHPQEVNDVNYLGTINLAEACKRELPNLKKFVFASTMEIYGCQPPNKPFDETTIPYPNSPYAVSKYAAEMHLRYLFLTYKFPVVIGRGSNIFGRKNDTYFVVEAAIVRMLKNPDDIEMGNSKPVRSFIYIDDAAEFYKAILKSENKKILGEVFNTGPANGVSIKELVEKIAKLLKWKGKIKWHTREIRSGEIFYLNTKNEKAKRVLGWKPKYTLEEGLQKDIDYWKRKLGL